MGRQRVHAGADLLEQVRHSFVFKRQAATKQRVENDATRPDVDFWPRVETRGDHFRRGVVGRAARRAQEFAVQEDIGEAKVSHLEVIVAVQQQVLGLEIAVHDTVEVAVLDASDELLEDSPCFVRRELEGHLSVP
jgi:hypothetical protein